MLQRSLDERHLSDGLEYQQLRAVLAKGAERAPPPCLVRRYHVCVDCGLPAVGLHTQHRITIVTVVMAQGYDAMNGRTLQFYCGFTLGPKSLRCEGAVWCEGGSGRCSPPIVLLFSSVFAVRSASVLSADLLPRKHMRRLWLHVGAAKVEMRGSKRSSIHDPAQAPLPAHLAHVPFLGGCTGCLHG